MVSHHSSPAQHRPVNHQHESGRRDPRNLNRYVHHRFEGRRFANGSTEIQFEGFWFGCAVWPQWVFVDEIYFVEGPNGVFFVYNYNNPALMVQVAFVE